MKLISKKNYSTIIPLFKELNHIPALSAILLGNTPAKIFVNSAINPSSGFIWTKWGEYFLAGDAENKKYNSELKQLLDNDLFFISHQLGETSPNIYYSGSKWAKTIEVLFSTKSPILEEKLGLRFSNEQFDSNKFGKLNAEFSVIPLSQKMLKKTLNGEEVWKDIEQSWDRRIKFEDRGWGFGIVHEKMIKASCYPKFVGDEICEIKFRSFVHNLDPKIMFKAVSATLMQGVNLGLELIWIGWNWDEKSISFAKEAGFKFAFKIPLYFVIIDPILTHSSNAKHHFSKGDYLRANFHLNRIVELGDQAGEWLYLRGCCKAVLENNDAALNDLSKAIEQGFTAIDRMKKQSELTILHSLPEWQRLTNNR